MLLIPGSLPCYLVVVVVMLTCVLEARRSCCRVLDVVWRGNAAAAGAGVDSAAAAAPSLVAGRFYP